MERLGWLLNIFFFSILLAYLGYLKAEISAYFVSLLLFLYGAKKLYELKKEVKEW